MIEYLRIRGIYCQKVHSGAIFVKRGPHTYKVKLADQGTPDLECCVRGHYLAIEVKVSPEEHEEWERQWEAYLATGTNERNRTMKTSWERSVLQQMEHDKIRAAGGEVIVCSSVNELEQDIDTLIAEYEQEAQFLQEAKKATMMPA